MCRAVNDATLTKAGDIYQYFIALKDCFEMEEEETLQIEVSGDVSVINKNGGTYQKEVKHHFGDNKLSERDIDFWKTLANWYVDYDNIKKFQDLILFTTSSISEDSVFNSWNKSKKNEKLRVLKEIGSIHKQKEETFRKQYNRIFNDNYDEDKLLEIIDKFKISYAQVSLSGISAEFVKYIGYIPEENRDSYIGALLGQILSKIKNPPHKWEFSKKEFNKILEATSPAYAQQGLIPLPIEYALEEPSVNDIKRISRKRFIDEIRKIQYEEKISPAISDYWKTEITVAKYFCNNFMYLRSLPLYVRSLQDRMEYAKSDRDLDADGECLEKQIKLSKKFYNEVMVWRAEDFGSIIRNQDFFQRGIIHNIVDDGKVNWKVGDESEY